MIELQEPSDLMVVAERWTPSGREIPESKRYGGLDWEKMLDVYSYDALELEDILRRNVVRDGRSRGTRDPTVGMRETATVSDPGRETVGARVPRARRLVGPELTDKFEMWSLEGGTALDVDRAGVIAVVTRGAGLLNGRTIRQGDRLVLVDEGKVFVSGEVTVVVCFRR